MPRSRQKADEEDNLSPFILARWICWAIATAVFLSFGAIALGWTQVETLTPGTAVFFVVAEFTLIIAGVAAGVAKGQREALDAIATVSEKVDRLQPAISSDLGRLAAQLEQANLQLSLVREDQVVMRRSTLRTAGRVEGMVGAEERLGELIEQAAREGVADGVDQVESVARTTAANAVEELSKKIETRFDTLEAVAEANRERHLHDVAEAYELGKLVGPGESTV
jgi:hypothetical protein